MALHGPLAGIRIVAIENAIAGPYGSMIMADLGAEVIKVEPPEGEISRRFAGPRHKGESFYFMAFNRNKKSVTLDLGTPRGHRAFCELTGKADVFWHNLRPAAIEQLGLGYGSLSKANRRLIMCSLSGYGSSGPYCDRPSYDVIGEAVSGTLSITGEPGQRPVRPGPPIADLATGMFGAIGVLSALAKRAETGVGQELEVAMLDASVSWLTYYFSYFFVSGLVPGPQGSGHLGLSPYGVYRTKDRYIALGVSWPRVARAIGADWLVDDPRFRDLEGRVKHKAELDRTIEEHLAKATAEQWLSVFEAEDIAAGPVLTIEEASRDPQVQHRNMVLKMEHPLGGEIRLVGNPVKMTGVGQEEYQPPPTLGQHTHDVLSGILDYSDDAIASLKAEEREHAPERARHVFKQL
ncbi:MAG: CoA transferase [Chloroflexota bacterium]